MIAGEDGFGIWLVAKLVGFALQAGLLLWLVWAVWEGHYYVAAGLVAGWALGSLAWPKRRPQRQ